MTTRTRLLWIDASAGVAGDMLLGALVDAGVALEGLQAAVDAVVPGAVRLRAEQVVRAGMRATKADVDVLVDDPPHRTWTTIRALLADADLEEPVRASATAAFARLAEAEGRVHGISPERVHFHEVGALDAIADIVAVCAGVRALGADTVLCSPIALGSGSIEAHHGVLPVPPPAVLELVRGWDVVGGGPGELATPTGAALVTSLASGTVPLPAMRVRDVGIGAGTRDTPGRANVVRIVAGTSSAPARAGLGVEDAVLIEANVDDLDPRLWPEVIAALMAAGASDVWLAPILMKKGRPAHTLHVLADPASADALADAVMAHTSTLGLRRARVAKDVLDRAWRPVAVAGGTVRVKIGHRGGRVVQAMPEFADVVALAAELGEPVADTLGAAQAAARAEGLEPGARWP